MIAEMKFRSPCEAYQWAVETLTIWRSGKSLAIHDDMTGPSTGKEYRLLDAISIDSIASRWDVVDAHGSLFFSYYMPSPHGDDSRNLSQAERDRLHVRLRAFEAELTLKGFIY